MSADVEQEIVFIRGEGGSVFRLGLPLHETISDKLRKGHITRVADADGNPFVANETAPKVAGLPTEAPGAGALKADWIGWAVACGLSPDDAEALSKTDLVELYRDASPVDTKAAADKFFAPPADQ